jgi:hypothetical protein
VPSKLRVDDLVTAIGPTLEKVSAPCPAGGIVEDGLVDHVASAASDEPLGVGRVDWLDDVPAGRAKRSEISRLVLFALAPDQVGLRIVDVGSCELAAPNLKLQRDQVLALEERVQDGG